MKPHEVLGIEPDATEEQARAAFRQIARKTHPDKAGGDAQTFAQARKALEQFTRPRVCPDCENTGRVRIRDGYAIRYQDCPRCFPATRT